MNLSLNAIRSRKTKRKVATPEDPRVESTLVEENVVRGDPVGHAADRELARSLCDAIDSLSETLRTTLILVGVDGLSHGEAAEILGCPEGTVAWRVHEARRKLKAYLSEHGHQEGTE